MVALHCEKRGGSEAVLGAPSEACGFLNYLRFTAMNCRTKPRTALFEACALLHGNRDASQTAHAEALMRCLGEALGKPAKLLAPGVSELTFDEAWLTQLHVACKRGDAQSVQFLIRSRVARQHQRLVQFLIARISEQFSQT